MGNVFETLNRINRLGREMHPGLSVNSIKHQITLLVRTLIFYMEIKNWFDISDNPNLTLALIRFPLINGAIYWPYINHTWPMARKLNVIDRHYRMLNAPTAIIAHATLGEVELASLEQEYSGLRIVLDKASWFLREGEVVLNLFIQNQRFYSIAFTLGVEKNEPLIFVGALQGSNVESAKDVYRSITHALYGMRPRDLLMIALKLMCSEFGINKIWAVSNENRQHNSPYFGNSHKEKVLVAYNEVWIEHGGTELDNGFFEIPAMIFRKSLEDVPSRKRSAYKRRYLMLDNLALNIKECCALHANQSLITHINH